MVQPPSPPSRPPSPPSSPPPRPPSAPSRPGDEEHDYAASYLRSSDPGAWAKHVLERHRAEQVAVADRRYGRRSILLGAAFTLLGVVIGLVGSFVATDLTNSAYDDRDKRDFVNTQKASAFGAFDTSINAAVGEDFDVFAQFTSSTTLSAADSSAAIQKVRDDTLAIRDSAANVEIFGSATIAKTADAMFDQAVVVEGKVTDSYHCQIVSPSSDDRAACTKAMVEEPAEAKKLITMETAFVALAKSELGVS